MIDAMRLSLIVHLGGCCIVDISTDPTYTIHNHVGLYERASADESSNHKSNGVILRCVAGSTRSNTLKLAHVCSTESISVCEWSRNTACTRHGRWCAMHNALQSAFYSSFFTPNCNFDRDEPHTIFFFSLKEK